MYNRAELNLNGLGFFNEYESIFKNYKDSTPEEKKTFDMKI